jgi:1-acyl-sn-glycerol-3-phosphate acyltransferase
MRAYRMLRWLLRLAARVFFRRLKVVGLEHIPPEGEAAVVFCGNHPNSLLDPVLITAATDRIVHFAAKDVLFESRLLRPLLRAMGAVPVRRRKEHPDGALDNQSAFEALFDVLGRGRAMGIFPEGISHNRSQLQRLKTGAARVALGAKARFPGQRIVLIPTGLNYFQRNRFRSSVLVQFGEPIEVTAGLLDAHAKDGRAVVHEVTAQVEGQLRGLTINAADWETVWVLDGVRRLYQPPHISLEERVELSRRFNEHYPQVKDQPEVRALFRRVRGYLMRLSAAGLSDRALRRDMSTVEVALHGSRHVVLLGIWLPLALVGAAVHVPLLLLLALAGERVAPRKDVVATTKFLAGLLCVLVTWAAVAGAVGWSWGWPWAVAALTALPVSGYATLRVLARLDALRNLAGTLARVLLLRREVRTLRRERLALEEAIARAVHRFKPEGLELMFPRPAPDSDEEWTL